MGSNRKKEEKKLDKKEDRENFAVKTYAARKIQYTFFPSLTKARLLINKNQKELKLSEVNEKDRNQLVALLKSNQLESIIKMEKMTSIVISSFKRGLINEGTVATLLESRQYYQQYSSLGEVHCLLMLDSGIPPQLTAPGKKYLEKLYAQLKSSQRVDIPKKYLTNDGKAIDGKTMFEKEIIDKLSMEMKENPLANMFYYITSKEKIPSIMYEDYDFHLIAHFDVYPERPKESSEDVFYTPSYNLRNVIGQLFFNDWTTLEYRLGSLTIDDISNASERGVRATSISTPEVKIPEKVHDIQVSPSGSLRHDQYHGERESYIPKKLKMALTWIKYLIRSETQIKWSKELWEIVDRNFFDSYGFLPPPGSWSNEVLFSEILERTKFIANSLRPIIWVPPITWIVVMDMADRPDIWKNNLNIDPLSKDMILLHPIESYLSLKEDKDFNVLGVKQKIFILTHLTQLYLDCEISKAWDDFKKIYTIPDEKDLSFKKYEKNYFGYSNQIYLDSSSIKSLIKSDLPKLRS